MFSGSATSEKTAAAERLVVDARLIEPGKQVPACGRAHFIAVMRYEIVRVVEGEFAERQILVMHSCPDMARAANPRLFRRDETYRLTLRPTNPRRSEGAVVDAFRKDKSPRFYATRTELSPPDAGPAPAPRAPGR